MLVNRDRDWMRLNPDPDPSGEAILCRHTLPRHLISDEELLAGLYRSRPAVIMPTPRLRRGDIAITPRPAAAILRQFADRLVRWRSSCSAASPDQLHRLHELADFRIAGERAAR